MATTNGITTLGSRTFLFGGASGIDTSALVTAAYNSRKLEADRIDVQIQSNTARYNAFSQMQTLANNVKTSLSNISKNYSILAQNNNLFDQRTGSMSTNTAVSAATLLDVSLNPGTELGNHEVTVVQKGHEHRVGSTASMTSATTALGYTGSFDLGVAGKTASTISVTSGMTLNDLAAAINATSTTSGVKATVAKVSETDYQLVLTGTDINKQIQVTNVSGDDVLQNIGITSGGTFTNELQAAQGAILKVDGINYTRDSNTISDIITGVTFTVKNQDPATTVTVAVQNDNSTIKAGIQDFMDAYNELRDFIKEQQVVNDGGDVSEGAVLFGDSILATLNNSLQGMLGGSYGSGGTNLSSLRGVGITMDVNNKLVMDETIFDAALIDKFSQVRDIFQTQVSADNTNFRMTKNTSSTTSMSFAMDITMNGDGTIATATVGGSSDFDISGNTITGKAGTAYEGMSFAYIGTSDTTVNVNLSGGLADSLTTLMNKYTDSLTGDITKEMNSITSQNVLLQSRADRVLERAAAYRDNLIDKYANFEAQLARAQTVLAQLRALTGQNDDNN